MTDTTSLAARLRALAGTAHTTSITDNAILDLADEVDTLEGNLIYMASCMAATAEDAAERKAMPRYQVDRQYGLMEICAKALTGIPAWRHASTRKHSLDRVMRAKATIAGKLKKVQ